MTHYTCYCMLQLLTAALFVCRCQAPQEGACPEAGPPKSSTSSPPARALRTASAGARSPRGRSPRHLCQTACLLQRPGLVCLLLSQQLVFVLCSSCLAGVCCSRVSKHAAWLWGIACLSGMTCAAGLARTSASADQQQLIYSDSLIPQPDVSADLLTTMPTCGMWATYLATASR